MQHLTHIIDKHHQNNGGFCRHYLTLYSIALGMEARNVLEFGAGFSSKVLLTALEETGGNLISCDVRRLEDTGNSYAFWLQHRKRWAYIQGDSRTQQHRLCQGAYDLVLHDGSHEPDIVRDDLRTIVPRIKKDGILLVHDTEHPSYGCGLHEAVRGALAAFRHSRVTLPYGYGLTIVRVEEDFGHGAVSLVWRKRR